MSIDWYLIQFTSDLRRKEPRNIGVAAESGGRWVVRFVGTDAQSNVTSGARRFGLTKSVYAPWVEYYSKMIVNGHLDSILTSQRRRPTEFRLLRGGVVITDDHLDDVADALFRDLVDGETRKPTEDRAKVLKGKVERVLQLAQIEPTAEVSVHARWGHDHNVGATDYDDDVRFDYSYTNGQVHLMDRLQLHQPSVEQARVLARDFNARVSGVREAGVADSFVAFYSGSALDELGDAILAPVWRVAHSIDVDSPKEAAGQVAQIMTHV